VRRRGSLRGNPFRGFPRETALFPETFRGGEGVGFKRNPRFVHARQYHSPVASRLTNPYPLTVTTFTRPNPYGPSGRCFLLFPFISPFRASSTPNVVRRFKNIKRCDRCFIISFSVSFCAPSRSCFVVARVSVLICSFSLTFKYRVFRDNGEHERNKLTAPGTTKK